MTLKNYANSTVALANINRLEELFRKQFKRAPKSQLVYSQEGDPKHPVHSIGLWDADKYSDEADFFTKNLK